MKVSHIVSLVIVLLVAGAPWFFGDSGFSSIAGIPLWAFYSICASITCAVVFAFLLQRYWSVLAGDEEQEQ